MITILQCIAGASRGRNTTRPAQLLLDSFPTQTPTLILYLLLGGLLLSPLPVVAAEPPPLLNELLYDPPGADGGHEYVELINPGAVGISLSGVSLDFCNGATPGDWTCLWRGGEGDSIPPGGLFLLGEEFVPGRDRTLVLGMQNGPEALRLRREDLILDLLGYGEGLPPELRELAPAADVSGKALGRRPDGVDTDRNALDWFAQDPTPGRLNYPDFRVELLEARGPWLPQRPGEEIRISLSALNSGAETWPMDLELRVVSWAVDESLDEQRAGREGGRGPELEALVFTLPAVSPDRLSEGEFVLPSLPRGEHLLRLGLGLPGAEAADSLCLRIRVGLGSLIVSEFLPAPATGCEWVECLALADLDGLAGFTLADLSGTTSLFRPPPMERGERILLCPDRAGLLALYSYLPAERVLELSPWPSLANSGEAAQAPGWTDGLRLEDAHGARCDGLLYRGDWLPGKGVSLERVYEFAPAGLSPWSPCPRGATPLDGGKPAGAALAAPDLLEVRPNPCDPRHETMSFCWAGSAASLTLLLFDAAGRELQRLSSPAGAGLTRLVWDGRDSRGRELPDGAYPYLAELRGEAGLRRVVGVCALLRAGGR